MQSFHLTSHTIRREYACRNVDEAHDVVELLSNLNRPVDEDIVNADVKDINGHATNTVIVETLDIGCEHRIMNVINRYIGTRLLDDEFEILERLDFDRWEDCSLFGSFAHQYGKYGKQLDNLVSKGYAEKDDCRDFYRRVK